MTKSNKHYLYILSLTACALLFTGCNQKTETSASPVTTVAVTEETAIEVLPETTKEESVAQEATDTNRTRTLTLTIVNMCNADIGMFSVIDPVSGEQADLSALANEEMISVEANWPQDTKEFQWAVYNQDGELYMEGKTDISSAKSAVTILLTGDGAIDDVEEILE